MNESGIPSQIPNGNETDTPSGIPIDSIAEQPDVAALTTPAEAAYISNPDSAESENKEPKDQLLEMIFDNIGKSKKVLEPIFAGYISKDAMSSVMFGIQVRATESVDKFSEISLQPAIAVLKKSDLSPYSADLKALVSKICNLTKTDVFSIMLNKQRTNTDESVLKILRKADPRASHAFFDHREPDSPIDINVFRLIDGDFNGTLGHELLHMLLVEHFPNITKPTYVVDQSGERSHTQKSIFLRTLNESLAHAFQLYFADTHPPAYKGYIRQKIDPETFKKIYEEMISPITKKMDSKGFLTFSLEAMQMLSEQGDDEDVLSNLEQYCTTYVDVPKNERSAQ